MIQPLRTRILVICDPPETEVKGIIIPNPKATNETGEVVAVGSEVKELEVGDRILLAKHTGVELEVDGQDYLMLDEPEVIAKETP